MAANDPISHKDPLYAELAGKVEQKLGLPVGLVRSIIQDGERTDADKVSSAGARHVGQFIPSTRNSMIEKYGIDPWLNAETAVESIGLLLKENLGRTGGDVEQAVRQYHGGLDPKNWGPVNNAYWGRVSRGFDRARTDAMSQGFSAFLAANPAVPSGRAASLAAQAGRAADAGPAATAPLDQMSASFGNWLQSQAAGVEEIPGSDAIAPPADGRNAVSPPQSFGDQLIGAGEAGLALATGATGGAVGALSGAAGGIGRALVDGSFGTPEAVRAIQAASEQGASNLTYAPRGQAGRDIASAAGGALAATLPIAPLTGELAALARAGATAQPSAAAAATVARPAVGAAAQTVRNAAQSAAERVARVVGRTPEEGPPTAGTRPSIGAAGVDMETLRRAQAAELPIPIELTKGQASRDPTQINFEKETAKVGDAGAPLRQRFDAQEGLIARNLDLLIDNTGAEAPNLLETGRAVSEALRKDAAKAKTEYKVKYRLAEKAGEMEDPVSTAGIVDYLTEQASFDSPGLAPVLSLARRELVRLGGAAEVDGVLMPRDIPLKQTELLRRQIGSAIGADPANATNMRSGVQLKNLIDDATEGLGGQRYKEARKARQRYGQLYENNSIVSQLMGSKRGSSDRQVALENIFNKTILAGSREDLSMLRRTLQVGKSEEGLQAWRELQGATVRHLLDQATGGVGMNSSGGQTFSPAKLHQAVQALDRGNKLDFVLGKKRAEMIRTIDDVSRAVLTTPAGSVNYSNTASTLMLALAEMGITGLVTGVAAPALTLITRQVKDAKLRKRVRDALAPANDKASQQQTRNNF